MKLEEHGCSSEEVKVTGSVRFFGHGETPWTWHACWQLELANSLKEMATSHFLQ